MHVCVILIIILLNNDSNHLIYLFKLKCFCTSNLKLYRSMNNIYKLKNTLCRVRFPLFTLPDKYYPCSLFLLYGYAFHT